MNIQTITSDQYPYLLKQISQLPKYLDVIGTIPSDENRFLCVIGARKHTSYGKEVCERLIAGLAGYPIVIVSGLALGIDSVAHAAALKAGLKTIAFPGSGLNEQVIYPEEHKPLAKQIVAAGGALVSPFARDQIGVYWSFPTRNRLMAGISHAVLIIEAGQGSGTLGTAEYATQLNRDLLVVPGPIFSPLSYGPHYLIENGATPITCSEDILEALDFAVERESPVQLPLKKRIVQRHLSFKEKHSVVDLDQLNLSPDERIICEFLKNEKLSATDLIDKTSWSFSKLSVTISELEMKNLVIQEGSSYKMKVATSPIIM